MFKVMIIDDSEADQFLASTVIEEVPMNITLLQAYDGQEALNILKTESIQPNVIFLDINMPVMNGLEFLDKYSKSELQTSVVVMLTSSSQQQDKDQSRAYSCVKEYFTKPLESNEVESFLLREIKHEAS